MEFFSKYKKIFLGLGFIAVVLILGYLIYASFFRASAPTEEPTITEKETGGGTLPEAETGTGEVITQSGGERLPAEGEETIQKADAVANGGLTKTEELISTPGLGITLAGDGADLQYYSKGDGKFYRLDKNGEISQLSDKIFHSVETVVWSPDKNKAILEYPDGANIIYDFSSGKQITMPSHWKDFDFSPDGSRLVLKSMGLDSDNRWLAVANSDGSQARTIEPLGDKDSTVYPAWSPNNQILAMYTEGVDFDRQEVFFVGLNNENFKSTIIEGRGFQPKWAPGGEQLLYSVYSSKTNLKPSLWIVNAEGELIGSGRKSLNVETWAEKCVFASSTELYCAVPDNLVEGAGMFPELAKTTNDRLYKIDTATGLRKMVAIPDGDYSMSDLIISDNGYYLYFTDNKTGSLKKIGLK